MNSEKKLKFLKILDYFFVLRPTLFFPVWTISLVGYWAQLRFDDHDGTLLHTFTIGTLNIKFIITIGLLTLAMGASFLLNQIEDVETDKLNNKLFLIANGDISLRNAYIETITLVIIPFMILSWLKFSLAIVSLLAFLITGWFYSCKPFKFKDKPIGGLIINILGFYIVFAFGWLIQGTLNLKMLQQATPYILGMIAVYFFTTIPDIEGDKAVNKKTIAVKYGMNFTLWSGLVTDIIAVLTALWMKDIVALIPTVLILPFFALAVNKKSIKEILRANKFAALFLSLTICYKFPGYLVFIAFLFFFSKWYYKRRFGIDYPSLRK